MRAAVLGLPALALCAPPLASADGSAAAIAARVAATLASMTISEKARALDIFRAADMLTDGAVDMEKAARTMGDLSAGVGVLHDVYPYPAIANRMMEALQNASRLKSPPLFGAEATHGVQMDDHTIFPSPIGLAATWDVDLLRRYGSVVGSEARAAGLHVAWAPVLGLCREPRWGRCEEMMGEDPALAAALGAAAVQGLTDAAGDGLAGAAGVAPLIKHYVAYSAPEGGHNCAPAHVGRRELLTTFLPPFVAAMEAGAQAAMVSYNEVDGEPNAASAYLLSDLLRHGGNSTGGNGPSGGAAKGGWGGYISSDFGAIHNLAHAHGVAATDADAIAQYIGAGGSVQGFDYDHQTWHDAIVNKTADGSLPMAALDAAVARVLAVKEQLGLTAAHATVANTSAYEALVTSAAHEAVALDAARRGMTLLQNEVDTGGGLPSPARVLPLDAAKLRSVLVLGPNADQPQCGDYAAGGSWGGDRCGGGPINNARTSSIVGGIKRLLKLEAAAGVDLAYYPGIPIADRNGSAPYYTTVQRHSFTTTVAASATSEEEAEVEGITGTYWASADRSGAPAFSRNDGLLSFHFLNFGPDPVLLPASAFSARWEGTLTPDTTVAAALFSIAGRGGDANATLWLDGVMVLDWQQGGSASCAAAARGEVPHEEEAEEGEEPRRPNNNGVPFHGRTAEAAKRPCTAADPQLTQLPVSLTRGAPLKVRFEYAQADSTGQHPAFALQWSLQGARSQHDALAEIASLPQEGAAVVLAVGGGTSVTSGEGVDRASLGLPGAQLAFVKGVRAACVRRGVPLALVVSQGKAFGEQWIKASMPAVLETWQGGQAQGQATAETLFGANNPAGRTAVSFPVSADVLPVFYNRKPTAGRGGYSNPPTIPGGLYPPASASSASVLWPFGHGLSYGATFEYGKIALSPSVAEASAAGGAVKVSFDVTNNGTAAAEEVVQLYVRDDLATVTTPVMQLRAFARLPALEPGATRRVTLALDVLRDLWLVDRDLQKVVEPGTFTLMVGGASDKIQQTASLAVSAPPRAPPIPTNQKVQKNQYRQ